MANLVLIFNLFFCVWASAAQFDATMAIETLQYSSVPMANNFITLSAENSKLTLQCGTQTKLTIETNKGSRSYQAFDFYAQGCANLLQSMLALGMKQGQMVRARFFGAEIYPGLMIGMNTHLVYTPAGSNDEGVFKSL